MPISRGNSYPSIIHHTSLTGKEFGASKRFEDCSDKTFPARTASSQRIIIYLRNVFPLDSNRHEPQISSNHKNRHRRKRDAPLTRSKIEVGDTVINTWDYHRNHRWLAGCCGAFIIQEGRRSESRARPLYKETTYPTGEALVSSIFPDSSVFCYFSSFIPSSLVTRDRHLRNNCPRENFMVERR